MHVCVCVCVRVCVRICVHACVLHLAGEGVLDPTLYSFMKSVHSSLHRTGLRSSALKPWERPVVIVRVVKIHLAFSTWHKLRELP